MWGSSLAIKWGAEKRAVTLHDGKGQGNNIAVFPTFVQGICAQLDLWRASKNYRNKRFADAIAIWSGHNGDAPPLGAVLILAGWFLLLWDRNNPFIGWVLGVGGLLLGLDWLSSYPD